MVKLIEWLRVFNSWRVQTVEPLIIQQPIIRLWACRGDLLDNGF